MSILCTSYIPLVYLVYMYLLYTLTKKMLIKYKYYLLYTLIIIKHINKVQIQ
jgi:hypothetical protein